MLCENCNTNEATVHYTEVINGVKNEHHLCKNCAKDVKIGLPDGDFSFANLIKGILSANGTLVKNEEKNVYSRIVCTKCGMSYEDYTKAGKLGCVECYDIFGPLIIEDIKKIQGSFTHKGKSLVRKMPVIENEKEKEISELQEQLKYAIETEEYEEAARLRDEIKLIEGRKNADA